MVKIIKDGKEVYISDVKLSDNVINLIMYYINN